MATEVYTRSSDDLIMRDPALQDLVKAELVNLAKRQQDIIHRQQDVLDHQHATIAAALDRLAWADAAGAARILLSIRSGAR